MIFKKILRHLVKAFLKKLNSPMPFPAALPLVYLQGRDGKNKIDRSFLARNIIYSYMSILPQLIENFQDFRIAFLLWPGKTKKYFWPESC